LDEDARLCSLSVFDAFRLLQGLVNVPVQEREAMFFGGLFSYDLVAGFEDLPQLEAGNRCPDYCFYLAETLMVIDHQKKAPAFRPVFLPPDAEKQRLNARLAQLSQQLTEPAPPLPVTEVPQMRCECNQSDEEFGAVVRGCKSDSRGRNFPGSSVPPFLAALPVTAGSLLCAEEKVTPAHTCFSCRTTISRCLAPPRKAR
jgi:anthranilate synthase component 1